MYVTMSIAFRLVIAASNIAVLSNARPLGRSFLRLVDGRPVLLGRLLEKRRELRNDPGDHRLRRIKYFRPDFLGYVLSHIPACHNDGFSRRKVLRAPDSFMPWLFKLIFETLYQFVELL